MEYKVFNVFDAAVQAYLQPFFFQQAAQAKRAFENNVADETSEMNRHPEDFTLFEIGTYDDNTAKLTSLATPISHCTALEVKAKIKALEEVQKSCVQ